VPQCITFSSDIVNIGVTTGICIITSKYNRLWSGSVIMQGKIIHSFSYLVVLFKYSIVLLLSVLSIIKYAIL